MKKHYKTIEISLVKYDDELDLDIEAKIQVGVIVVPPWKGSMWTAPSDVDYYGYTELDDIQLLSITASDENGFVELPEKYKNADVEDIWEEEDIYKELQNV